MCVQLLNYLRHALRYADEDLAHAHLDEMEASLGARIDALLHRTHGTDLLCWKVPAVAAMPDAALR